MPDPLSNVRQLCQDNRELHVGYHVDIGRLDSAGACAALGGSSAPDPGPLYGPELIPSASATPAQSLWLPAFTTSEEMSRWSTSVPRTRASMRDIITWPMCPHVLADGIVIDPFGQNLQIPVQLLEQVASAEPPAWRGAIPAFATFNPRDTAWPAPAAEPVPVPAEGPAFGRRLDHDMARTSRTDARVSAFRHVHEYMEVGGRVLLEYACMRDEEDLRRFITESMDAGACVAPASWYGPATATVPWNGADRQWVAVHTDMRSYMGRPGGNRVIQITLENVANLLMSWDPLGVEAAGVVINPCGGRPVLLPTPELPDLLC